MTARALRRRYGHAGHGYRWPLSKIGPRGVLPVAGERYVVAKERRSGRAVAWADQVNGKVLRAIYEEVNRLGLAKPITVYGHVALVSDVGTWRFIQLPGEVRGLEVVQ